jgi:hypothetical protein
MTRTSSPNDYSVGASLRDRATRPADQAPAGLGDTASVTSADDTRQQRRFAARKGKREAGFTPIPTGKRYRQTLAQKLADNAPQRFRMLPNGGYQTYHPTKGWRTVSPKRLKHFPGFVA